MNTTAKTDVAVVGAGPAGLAAALRLAEAGVAVTVLDEGPQPGGQIYRQPPPGLKPRNPEAWGPAYTDGKGLLDAFAVQRDRIVYRPGTAVWGLFDAGHTLSLLHDDRLDQLHAGAVIVAAGALERVQPVPGWTLPGVTTVGAAQIALKAQGLLPGRRVLVAGSGPLLPVLASQLLAAGAGVAAVLESGALSDIGWRLPLLLRQPALVREGLRLRRTLRKAGTPLLERHAVVALHGKERVQAAYIARLRRDGTPVADSRCTVEVDAVALGSGFLPNTELLRQAGAAHDWDALRGGWVPRRDPWLQTTVSGLYAAGDGAGIGGAQAAALEGRLAALGLLVRLGRMADSDAHRAATPLRRRLAGLLAFQRLLWRMSTDRPGLLTALTPDTVVCRCEDVTRAQIDACLRDGHRRLDTLKRITRAGMGFCQGRVCAPTVAALAHAAGASPEAVGWPNPRPPLRPLPLAAFAGELGPPSATEVEQP